MEMVGAGYCRHAIRRQSRFFLGGESFGTLPEFNMEPENGGFQKDSLLPGADFQVPCLTSRVYAFKRVDTTLNMLWQWCFFLPVNENRQAWGV